MGEAVDFTVCMQIDTDEYSAYAYA